MKAISIGAAAGLLFALGYALLVIGPDLAWDLTAIGFAIDGFLFSCLAIPQVLQS